ncbi:unnamed protein product, partial [Clonostachys chloroleuca]
PAFPPPHVSRSSHIKNVTMMDDYNRCACSASFPSIELLAEHLAEIRSQESYHATQLKHCRTHLIDNHSDDQQGGEVPRDPDPGCRICPFPGCKRTEPFSTNYKLWRHYAQHVRIEEVCVFCFKSFEFASEFIRHSEENHRAKSGRKAAYMKETFNDVSRHVTTQLYTAKASFTERLIFESTSESKKRTWDVAGIDEGEESNARKGEAIALTTEDSQCRRVISSLQEANYPNAKPNASALHSLPMDTGFLSVAIAPEVTGPNGNNDTLDTTSAQLICHNPMQEGVVGDPYNARLLQIVSSVPFTGDFDWGESEGWGVPGSVA